MGVKYHHSIAQMVKLVDTHDSGSCASRHAGSNPVLGTNFSIEFLKNKASLRVKIIKD